jgi:hypothetical protein
MILINLINEVKDIAISTMHLTGQTAVQDRIYRLDELIDEVNKLPGKETK